MLYTGKQIVARVKSHIRRRGGKYNAWFVGVSPDARARLFTKHSVRKKGDCWILVHAESAQVAQKVKRYLVKKLGLAGASEVADMAADFVYAYKKSANTQP